MASVTMQILILAIVNSALAFGALFILDKPPTPPSEFVSRVHDFD